MSDRDDGRLPEWSVTGARMLLVIPTFNEAAHIVALLQRLMLDTAPFVNARIVVVDGGSTDGTAELVAEVCLRCPSVILLNNPARLQGAAVNLAVRRLGQDADILIRCDAHSIYPEGYCQRLIDTLDRMGADAVVVPMDSVGHTSVQKAVAWLSNSPLGTGGSAHRGGRGSGFVDHGHHAAFRLHTFRAAGGYDETFSHNEDAELDCRMGALGAKIYLDGTIRLRYEPRAGFKALWRQYFRYGVGRSRTVRRHPASIRFRQLAVPANLILSAMAIALGPWFRGVLAYPAAYFATLVVASMVMALRHRSLCGLLAGPAALVMHVAWAMGFLSGLVTRRQRQWRREMAVPLA